MNKGQIPHVNIVVGFCVAGMVGYTVFSGYVVFYLQDPALTGDVIGTWKSFAVGIFAFWVGSSSGGKAKDESPAGTEKDPLSVQGADKDKKPVVTEAAEVPQPKPDNPDG